VTSGSLSYPGLPASTGNKISFGGDANGYYRIFTGQSAGTVYASFIFNVTSLPGSAKGDYFIFLGNSSAVASPVYLRASTISGKFNIGLGKRNNLAITWLSQNLDMNISYYLVFAITYVSGTGNDISELWLNPTGNTKPAPDISITTGADLNVFANLNRIILNHSGDNNTGLHMNMDELRVSTDWFGLSTVSTPLAPGTLTATTSSPTSISLSWVDNSDNETGFEIERSMDGTTFTSLTTVAANTVIYTDTGLTASTKYYYQVRAKGTAGNSNYSNIADVTTGSAATVPSVPGTLLATSGSSDSIGLSWVDNSDNETGFEIERSSDGIIFTLLSSVASNTVSYSDTGLTESTKYYYRVRATGTEGNSGFSNIASATTWVALPSSPGTLTATASSPTSISLSWTDNSGNETGFEIEHSPDGTTFTSLKTVGANISTYTDTGLTASTQYYYRVRATGTTGNSDYSNIAGAVTMAGIPSAPGTLEASAESSSSISLTWRDNSNNETWFEIERSSDGTNFSLLTTAAPNIMAYTDHDLSASAKYYYRIRATGVAGSSDYSNIANATTEIKVYGKVEAGNFLSPNGDGKNDRWIIKNIEQYPDNEVKIFDRAGRLVFRKKGYNNDWDGTFNGSKLSSGVYIYILNSGTGITPVKGTLTIILDRK